MHRERTPALARAPEKRKYLTRIMRFLLPVLLAFSLPLFAEENIVKNPPLPVLAAASGQGLTLTFSAGGKTDTRPARLVSLYVPAGQPVTPFLPPGAFTAKWTGEINSPLRADCTLLVEVRGSVKMSLNGAPLLEGAGTATAQAISKPVQLQKGANAFEIEFTSDGKSDASLQLKWSSKEFAPEPMPPTVFSHALAENDLREGERTARGSDAFRAAPLLSVSRGCHAHSTARRGHAGAGAGCAGLR